MPYSAHFRGSVLRYSTLLGLPAVLLFILGSVLAVDNDLKPIAGDSVDVSVGSFLKALASSDKEQQERASIYLLAISDLGEGKDWCDYRKFKTITLREFVYEYLKKQPAIRRTEKAAPLILEALHASFPCGRPQ